MFPVLISLAALTCPLIYLAALHRHLRGALPRLGLAVGATGIAVFFIGGSVVLDLGPSLTLCLVIALGVPCAVTTLLSVRPPELSSVAELGPEDLKRLAGTEFGFDRRLATLWVFMCATWAALSCAWTIPADGWTLFTLVAGALVAVVAGIANWDAGRRFLRFNDVGIEARSFQCRWIDLKLAKLVVDRAGSSLHLGAHDRGGRVLQLSWGGAFGRAHWWRSVENGQSLQEAIESVADRPTR